MWLFVEATDRLLRYADDKWSWMKSRGLNTPCNAMDQTMLNEVLPSLVTGRPMWRYALRDCQPEANQSKWSDGLRAQIESIDKFTDWDARVKVSLVADRATGRPAA